MVKLFPVFRCATQELRVAAFLIQVPCSRTRALKQVPFGSDQVLLAFGEFTPSVVAVNQCSTVTPRQKAT